MKVDLEFDLAGRIPQLLDVEVKDAVDAAILSSSDPRHADELLQPIRTWLNTHYHARTGTAAAPIRVRLTLHASID
jgi:hypothetical protein